MSANLGLFVTIKLCELYPVNRYTFSFTLKESILGARPGAFRPSHIFSRPVHGRDMSGDCPGSLQSFHSKCSYSVQFSDSNCAQVQTEILARMQGNASWVDPHNGGTYTVLSSLGCPGSGCLSILGQRVTGLAPHYTDKFKLTFNGDQSQCTMTACSESQGSSLYDASTNYCNMHVLYCTGAQGCPSVDNATSSTRSRTSIAHMAAVSRTMQTSASLIR